MAKNATFANNLLKLIFNAVGMANLADNTATAPATNLYISLHTADPTSAGNQASNECNYTGYNRIAVVRSSSGWTVSGENVSPTATISFPACTGGTNTAAYWGVGLSASGAGALLYSGTVTPNISVASGVTPQLTTASTINES